MYICCRIQFFEHAILSHLNMFCLEDFLDSLKFAEFIWTTDVHFQPNEPKNYSLNNHYTAVQPIGLTTVRPSHGLPPEGTSLPSICYYSRCFPIKLYESDDWAPCPSTLHTRCSSETLHTINTSNVMLHIVSPHASQHYSFPNLWTILFFVLILIFRIPWWPWEGACKHLTGTTFRFSIIRLQHSVAQTFRSRSTELLISSGLFLFCELSVTNATSTGEGFYDDCSVVNVYTKAVFLKVQDDPKSPLVLRVAAIGPCHIQPASDGGNPIQEYAAIHQAVSVAAVRQVRYISRGHSTQLYLTHRFDHFECVSYFLCHHERKRRKKPRPSNGLRSWHSLSPFT